MSVEIQRPTTVVSTFNSYHERGLPPREWLTAGRGESKAAKKTQPAACPLDMHAWSRASQNTPDAVRSERASPSAASQPDAESVSGTPPLPHECAWGDGSPVGEAFVEASSSPTAGSDYSELYADCRDCSVASSVTTQSPDDGSQCFDEGAV